MTYSNSGSPVDLAEVNSNLSIKKCWDKEEEYVNDWKLRARNDGVEFLNQLLQELLRIKRIDLVGEILSDPVIKKLIQPMKHTSTTLLQSKVTEERNEEEQGLLLHNREAQKCRMSTCRTVTVVLLSMLLVALICFIIVQIIALIEVSDIALKKEKEANRIVAEGDTVSLYMLDKEYINTIQISEKVEKGDSKHSVTLVLVPTDELQYDVIYESESWNATAYVPDLPIINNIYVYLNTGSKVNFDIWIGNGNNKKSATLYIFDDIDNLNDYIRYSEVKSPVFTKEIPIEGKDGKRIPHNVIFTSPADGYYFIILLAPEANIQFSYNVNTTELVTDVDQYTSDYPSCVIDTERNCTLTTSNAKQPSSENLTLLAAASTKYDISSKITHVHLNFTNRSYLMTVPSIIFGITVGVALLVIISLLVIARYVACKKKRNRRGYVSIN
uniref:Death domain-containing protein n=1 Tax=Amphimedon queenslandica TaxID=400682 RepID=A0A1X7UJC7_AMPQE